MKDKKERQRQSLKLVGQTGKGTDYFNLINLKCFCQECVRLLLTTAEYKGK